MAVMSARMSGREKSSGRSQFLIRSYCYGDASNEAIRLTSAVSAVEARGSAPTSGPSSTADSGAPLLPVPSAVSGRELRLPFVTLRPSWSMATSAAHYEWAPPRSSRSDAATASSWGRRGGRGRGWVSSLGGKGRSVIWWVRACRVAVGSAPSESGSAAFDALRARRACAPAPRTHVGRLRCGTGPGARGRVRHP